MNKPPIENVLKVLAIRKQITDLYAQSDELVAKLHREFGAGRFDYALAELESGMVSEVVFSGTAIDGKVLEVRTVNPVLDLANELLENGAYLKFEIIDNLEALAHGQPIFKSTAISPLSFASGSLKRKPKSLAEQEQEDGTD